MVRTKLFEVKYKVNTRNGESYLIDYEIDKRINEFMEEYQGEIISITPVNGGMNGDTYLLVTFRELGYETEEYYS